MDVFVRTGQHGPKDEINPKLILKNKGTFAPFISMIIRSVGIKSNKR